MANATPPTIDATLFWQRVDVRGPDECWPWKLSTTRAGYGRCVLGKWGQTTAQRVAWALATGEPFPPKAVQICHRCDNPPCCNPAHLFAGSMAENMADMRAKGRGARGPTHGRTTKPHRTPRGERHGAARLTADDVRAIRALGASLSQPAIAARFGVTRSNIGMIMRRQTWTHV